MRIFTRLGVALIAAPVSLYIAAHLYLSGSTRHVKVLPLHDYADTFWAWAQGHSVQDRRTAVLVFGDRTVYDSTSEERINGRRESWPYEFCDLLQCIEYRNLAAVPSEGVAAANGPDPIGALGSNQIYRHRRRNEDNSAPPPRAGRLLPDLAAQIELVEGQGPLNATVEEIYIILSFGTWDVYHTAGLEADAARDLLNATVEGIFSGLERLRSHLTANFDIGRQSMSDDGPITMPPRLHLIVPSLVDPTLYPGWQSQRPEPLAPKTRAWHQRHGSELAKFWDDAFKLRFRHMIGYPDYVRGGNLVRLIGKIAQNANGGEPAHEDDTKESAAQGGDSLGLSNIFMPDLQTPLLTAMIHDQLDRLELRHVLEPNAPSERYEDVSNPCVADPHHKSSPRWRLSTSDDGSGPVNHSKSTDGAPATGTICPDPSQHLWWDSWSAGPRMQHFFAELVASQARAEMVREARGRMSSGNGGAPYGHGGAIEDVLAAQDKEFEAVDEREERLAEQRRLNEEEARKRREKEEEEQRKKQAEEDEEGKRKAAEEAERKKKADEEYEKRKAEAEQRKKEMAERKKQKQQDEEDKERERKAQTENQQGQARDGRSGARPTE